MLFSKIFFTLNLISINPFHLTVLTGPQNQSKGKFSLQSDKVHTKIDFLGHFGLKGVTGDDKKVKI